eukprot:14268627-Alexandrium_andersonii.AAC.1
MSPPWPRCQVELGGDSLSFLTVRQVRCVATCVMLICCIAYPADGGCVDSVAVGSGPRRNKQLWWVRVLQDRAHCDVKHTWARRSEMAEGILRGLARGVQ